MSKKVTVAWECPECRKQHLWKWDRLDAEWAASIHMECDKDCKGCGAKMNTAIFRIGRDAYAAKWVPR